MDTDPPTSVFANPPRDYRAIIHGEDGRVIAVRSLVAGTDADAIAQIDAWVRDFATDLWDGLRFVEHVAGRPVLMGCLLVMTGLSAVG